ncbi:MAG: TIM-barrel domain-containing protein, partial [Micrococcales bacterium]
AMGTTEGLLKAMPERRTFILSRAGFAGIQRYAANWMGDNMSRWDHLWLQIPMATGLSLSGQSFVGADIGGFAENSSPELFARWIQAGALTPFARNHNAAGLIDQYAFAFGKSVLDIARAAIKLRYTLMPYLYSAFVRCTEDGSPIQRPLIFDYQYDEAVRDLDTQYLLGEKLLVAPIFEPGVTKRGVYLPEGTWYNWHTGEAVTSAGETHGVDAPLETIPLFVKEGSVIPTWSEAVQSTADYQPVEISLRVYAPANDGEYHSMLQEDDGLTDSALTGAMVRTRFTVTRRGANITVAAASTGAGFNEFRRERFRIQLIGAVAAEGNEVVLENSGNGFEIGFSIGA